MNMKNMVAKILMVAVIILVATSSTHGTLMGYQASSSLNSTLWQIDLETLEQTSIGVTGVPSINALDISPVDGDLYGLSFYDLYKLDTENGIATSIAKDILPYGAKSMAFAPDGTAYVLNSVDDDVMLYSIDVNTGATTEVVTLPPYTHVTAFAIDTAGNGIAWSTASNWLIHIDLTDGSTTSLGHLTGTFQAFDYGPDGILYASSEGGIYTIDVANLDATFLGNFENTSSMYGFTVIPEPATLLFLTLGMLGLLRRRRT